MVIRYWADNICTKITSLTFNFLKLFSYCSPNMGIVTTVFITSLSNKQTLTHWFKVVFNQECQVKKCQQQILMTLTMHIIVKWSASLSGLFFIVLISFYYFLTFKLIRFFSYPSSATSCLLKTFHIFVFFSRITLFQINIAKRGFTFVKRKSPSFFQREVNDKIEEKHWIKSNLLLKNHRAIFSQLCTKIFGRKEFKLLQMKDPNLIQREIKTK